MSLRRRSISFLTVVLLASCQIEDEPFGDEVTRGDLSLVDHAAWELLSEEDDIFQDEANFAQCPSNGFGVEDGFFEVNTDICRYATFRQYALEKIHADETIRFVLWHSPLSSPEPATGHVAISIDEQLYWEKNLEIPGDAAVYDETFELTQAVDKGAPIYLHIHNHGNNSYRLGFIEKQEAR